MGHSYKWHAGCGAFQKEKNRRQRSGTHTITVDCTHTATP